MKTRGALAVVFLLALSVVGVVRAESPAVELGALRAHVGFLADDRLQGRDTGSPEYGIAALYAATRFAEYGLAPGAGGSYLQPVRFVESRVENPSLRITATASGESGAQPLVPLDDYILTGSVSAPRSRVSAPVVFVGYGIDAPELGETDYAGVDVRGKVVLLFSGAPASFPNDQRAHHSSRRLKAELAERHGAIGVLTIRDRSDEKRVPWERVVTYAHRPRTAWKGANGEVQDAFPGLALFAALSRPGAGKLFAGSGVDLEALLDAAEKRESRSRLLPIRVDASCDNALREVESPNVVGVLPGSDPALRGEYVVVTAHLDHVGVGTAVDGDTIYNGFYDNAMGSAILLEAARILGKSAERPRRSILFLLVTGEERGLLGSDYFASYPTIPLAAIVANVNVDMPLLLTPTADLVAFGADHSSLGPLTDRAAKDNGFALIPDPMPEEVIFVRSDQYSFVRRGVPAIYLTAGSGSVDGGEAQRKASAAFVATNYHRPSDQLDLGADWPSVARFTATEVELARLIADADARPQWNSGDFFGDTFRPAH